MSAVEEVRELLDKNGIKYDERDNGIVTEFYADYVESISDYLYTIFVVGACVSVESSYLTPEQAIELMRKPTCYIVQQYNDFSGWLHFCSTCGHRINVGEYDHKTGEPSDILNYCPWCGRRVVDK